MNSRMESKSMKVRTKRVSKVKQMAGGQSVGAQKGKSEVSFFAVILERSMVLFSDAQVSGTNAPKGFFKRISISEFFA